MENRKLLKGILVVVISLSLVLGATVAFSMSSAHYGNNWNVMSAGGSSGGSRSSAHYKMAVDVIGGGVIGTSSSAHYSLSSGFAVFGAPSGVNQPSAPQNLTAVPGNGTITLNWDAPADNGGAAITNYKIYRSTSSGSETYYTSVNGATTTYVDTGVTNGIAYYYKVFAVNSAGEGPPSTEASATPNTVTSILVHFTGNEYNLVSFPFSVSSADIPNFIQAWTFDWTNGWTSPTTFTPGRGYWIKVSQTEDASFSGIVPSSNVSIAVAPGKYNLLGNPFSTSILLSALNSANSGHIETVYTFDWTNGWAFVNPSDYLEPGKGYWVKLDSTASTTFVFPAP